MSSNATSRLQWGEPPASFSLDFANIEEEELLAEAKLRLRHDHLVYVRRFPLSSDHLIQFLSHFGHLLPNYASTLSPSHGGPEDFINRVCFTNAKKEFGFQEAGALLIHTARSWRMPPPAWFSMLMVNKGDQRPGYSGASRLLRFRDVLRWLKESDGSNGPTIISQLLSFQVALPAKKVHEPSSPAPIVFSLGSLDSYDLGVRFRADIIDTVKLQSLVLDGADQGLQAVSRLVDAVANCGAVLEFQMEPGDLLIIDNRRFGHGRANVEAMQPDGGTNLREIWSTTIE